MSDRQDDHGGVADSGSGAPSQLEDNWAALGDRVSPPVPAGAAGVFTNRVLVYLRPDKVCTVLPYLDARRSGVVLAGAKPSDGVRVLEEAGVEVPRLIDPACYETYTATCEAPFKLPENRLRLASLDDVIDEQLRAGVTVALTPTGFIPAGGTDVLRAAARYFKQLGRDDAIFVAPLDVSLLGRAYIRQTTAILADLRRPAAIVMGRQFDPLEHSKQIIPNLRGLAATVSLMPLRTDFNAWYGGGRLSAGLTLPRLRRGWEQRRSTAAGSSGAFRFSVPERNAIFEHAARQAAAATEHIRCSARSDPAGAADAAWAVADTLHVAARALGNPELRRAADAYDRAARAGYGQIPRRTGEGSDLRTAARLMALTGRSTSDTTLAAVALVANLVALAIAVADLRQAEQHAAQAAAARAAASHLHAACIQARPPASAGQSQARQPGRPANAAEAARRDFPVPARPARAQPAGPGRSRPRPPGGPLPPRRAGPGR